MSGETIGENRGRRIAIIGAGFSGSLLALHLLQGCRPEDRIYLIEKHRHFGRGLAYSTGNPNHLLNVRAGNMSAFPDRPDHFVAWLAALPAAEKSSLGDLGPSGFAPRGLFGRYLQELLAAATSHAPHCHNLVLVNDEAVALHRQGEGFDLELAVGRRYAIDEAVLALGNYPPALSVPGYVGDPWHPLALANLDPWAPVLLIGSGLTAIDTIISLLDRGHQGPIHVLSRRGLWPRQHLAAGLAPLPAPWHYETPLGSARLVSLLRDVRRAARDAEKSGRGWRAAIDGLRPHTQRLWLEMPTAERARFLRHVRPWWDVHRHRAAPQVMARIEAAERSGQVARLRGRLQGHRHTGDFSHVDIALAGAAGITSLGVERVIDCTGPRSALAEIDSPLLQQLQERGHIRADALGLGLDVTHDNRLIGADGATRSLHAIGPLTRGVFWEITAVPDLRNACAALAARLLAETQPSAARKAWIAAKVSRERSPLMNSGQVESFTTAKSARRSI